MLKRKAFPLLIISLMFLIIHGGFIPNAAAVSLFGPVALGITGGESGIAISLSNPSNVVIFNSFTNSANQMAMYSTDTGSTWHAGTTVTSPGPHTDPDLTEDSFGNYYTFGFETLGPNGYFEFHFYKSTDGGATWTFLSTPAISPNTVVSLPGGGTANVCNLVTGVLPLDFPKIIADKSTTSPHKDSLYLYLQLLNLNTGPTACQNGSTPYPAVIRSIDGGATWIDAQAFSNAQVSGWSGEKDIGVTPDGTVLITANTSVGGVCSTTGGVVLTKSVDGGHTFSSSCVYNNPTIASSQAPIFSGGSGVIAAGYGTNAVIAANLGCISGCFGAPVFHYFSFSSTNDGSSWTGTPVRIDDVLIPDNPSLGSISRIMPAASMSSSNGRVDVAWADNRNGNPSTNGDMYASYSNDNGASFATNIRITSQSNCLINCLQGTDDFLAIASTSSSSYISFFFRDATGNTSAYFARIDNIPLADFRFSATSLPQGYVGTAMTTTLTVTALNGFTGSVVLTDTVPANLTCGSITPSTVTNSGTATLTCNSSVPGTYNVQITATSGALSHYVVIQFMFTDFTITANPASLTLSEGTSGTSLITVTSLGGFQGTVSIVASSSPQGIILTPSSTSIGVPPASSNSYYQSIFANCLYPLQTYTTTITGTVGPLSHSVLIQVTVNAACTGGGSGGSVATGTMILLPDGSEAPVQHLSKGDQIVMYDVFSHQTVTATITSVREVVVNNMLTIYTQDANPPLRVDANPKLRFYVWTSSGPVLSPVTGLQPGDMLYSYDMQAWVPVTRVTITYGTHTYYDLATNPTFNANGQFLSFIANGIADPCTSGCKQ